MNIGERAHPLGISLEDAFAQRIDIHGKVDLVAGQPQSLQHIEERFEDRQKSRRAEAAGIRRESEERDRDLAVLARPAAERNQAADAVSQHLGAFAAGMHIARA